MKKMFRLAVAITFILSTFKSTQAQEKPILESTPYAYTKENFRGFLAEKDGMIYVLKEKTVNDVKTLFLEKMGKNDLKPVSSIPLAKSMMANTALKQNFPDKVLFLGYDFKKDSILLMAQTLSYDGVLSDWYNIATCYSKDDRSNVIVKYKFSPDHSIFATAIFHHDYQDAVEEMEHPSKYDNLKNIRLFKTFNFEPVYGKDFYADSENKSVLQSSLTVDNSESIYFVVKRSEKNSVAVLEKNSPALKVLDLQIPGKKMEHGLTLNKISNEEIFVSGVYSDIEKDKKGYRQNPKLYVRIIDSKTLAVKDSKDFDIPADVYENLGIIKPMNYDPDPAIKKQHPLPYNVFENSGLIETDNFYYFKTQNSYRDPYTGIVGHNIIVCQLTKDFKLNWMKSDKQIGDFTSFRNQKDDIDFVLTEYDYGHGFFFSNFNIIDLKVTTTGAFSKKILHECTKKGDKIFQWLWLNDGNLLTFIDATRQNISRYGIFKIE